MKSVAAYLFHIYVVSLLCHYNIKINFTVRAFPVETV